MQCGEKTLLFQPGPTCTTSTVLKVFLKLGIQPVIELVHSTIRATVILGFK